MSSKLSYFALALTALIGVSGMVGCAPKKGTVSTDNSGASTNSTTGTTPFQISTPTVTPDLGSNGTSDSGGGSGTSNKVFESTIIDPLETAAYKKYLKPLFLNIKSDDPNDSMAIAKIFKIKTWYVVEAELKKISDDIIGVSFLGSTVQQIAVQTPKEVWIDKIIFDKMSVKEQSELFLHELVMNLYFFKFQPINEICKISNMINEEKDKTKCPEDSELMDSYLPAEKIKPLNATDYENIRFVTGWLLKNAKKPISEKEFRKILWLKGFDKRMFNPQNFEEHPVSTQDLEISKKELFNAINGATLSGRMPNICIGHTTKVEKSCVFEAKNTLIPFAGAQLPGLIFSLKTENDVLLEISTIFGDVAHLTATPRPDGGNDYTFSFALIKEKYSIGDRTYIGFFIFKKENLAPQAPLTLDSIIIKPGIVVSTDKERVPVCLVQAPAVKTFLDDAIIIKNKGAEISGAERMYLTMPPAAACSSSSI